LEVDDRIRAGCNDDDEHDKHVEERGYSRPVESYPERRNACIHDGCLTVEAQLRAAATVARPRDDGRSGSESRPP
jgi:hypothetical protein